MPRSECLSENSNRASTISGEWHTRAVATARFNFLSRKWSEPCHETYSTIKIKHLSAIDAPLSRLERRQTSKVHFVQPREICRKMQHNEMGVSSCRRASLLRLCGKQRAARRIATAYGENAHNSLRHAAVALRARHLNIIIIMEIQSCGCLFVCLLIHHPR
jgi:hypothetical protein